MAAGRLTLCVTSLPSESDLSVLSTSSDLPSLSTVCEPSLLPVHHFPISSQDSPILSPTVSGPPLLLVQDSVPFAIGSKIPAPTISESNILIPIVEVPLLDAKPPFVALPIITNPVANTFAPGLLYPSMHPPISQPALLLPRAPEHPRFHRYSHLP